MYGSGDEQDGSPGVKQHNGGGAIGSSPAVLPYQSLYIRKGVETYGPPVTTWIAEQVFSAVCPAPGRG